VITSIVFDFDGTLVDSNAIKRQGFYEVVAEDSGGRARMEQILDQVSGDRRAIFSAYLADTAAPGLERTRKAEALVRIYSQRVDAQVVAAPEIPGATALMEQLRRHQRRLYLNSATPIDSLRMIIERRGWRRLFEGIFGHPAGKIESARRVLAGTASGAESIAVVGDGADDRDSAAAIGCTFFPVGEARGTRPADRVFTLHELLEVLMEPVGPGNVTMV